MRVAFSYKYYTKSLSLIKNCSTIIIEKIHQKTSFVS